MPCAIVSNRYDRVDLKLEYIKICIQTHPIRRSSRTWTGPRRSRTRSSRPENGGKHLRRKKEVRFFGCCRNCKIGCHLQRKTCWWKTSEWKTCLRWTSRRPARRSRTSSGSKPACRRSPGIRERHIFKNVSWKQTVAATKEYFLSKFFCHVLMIRRKTSRRERLSCQIRAFRSVSVLHNLLCKTECPQTDAGSLINSFGKSANK